MQLVEELGSAKMQGLAPPRKGGLFATVNKQPALIERRRRELQVRLSISLLTDKVTNGIRHAWYLYVRCPVVHLLPLMHAICTCEICFLGIDATE